MRDLVCGAAVHRLSRWLAAAMDAYHGMPAVSCRYVLGRYISRIGAVPIPRLDGGRRGAPTHVVVGWGAPVGPLGDRGA